MRHQLFFKGSSLRVRESQDPESRVICGYAIVFNSESVPLYGDKWSEVREVIRPGAVTKSFLDQQDIKCTMFHDREILLARSNKGKGTLSYRVDSHGVYFEFSAPMTAQGDQALEAVRRGDIAGCSFTFAADFSSSEYVDEESRDEGGREVIVFHVKKVDMITEFTLASDPAYPDTSVEARELRKLMSGRSGRNGRKELAKELRALASEINGEPRGMTRKELAKELRTIAKSASY